VNTKGPVGAVNQSGQVGPVFAFDDHGTATAAVAPASYLQFQLDGFGTTGVARALPTNPLSNMGQFLGELREGIPKVPGKDIHDIVRDWKKKGRRAKSLARGGSNEYLNIQFGWVPFVNDLRDFAKVVKNHSRLAADYARDSGKDIRRHALVFKDTTTTATNFGGWVGVPAIQVDSAASKGSLSHTVKTDTLIQFNGAFTYYLPSDDSFVGKMQRYEALANKLYGTRLSPDLLWKLAPWSWAADWVGNVGSIIHNWSAFQNDGLVMRYGYLTADRTKAESWSGQNLIAKDGSVINASQTVTGRNLQRCAATPYGFGLNPSSFSAKQWSILAALGISRAPRSLL